MKTDFENIGKLPPQNIEMEKAVIAAVLIESGAIDEVMDIFQPEVFYLAAHQTICKACRELKAKGSPIELLTVSSQLKQTGELESVGGLYALTVIMNGIGSAANVSYHMRIVYEAYIKRLLATNSMETQAAAFDDTSDVFEVLDSAEHGFQKIQRAALSGRVANLETIIAEAMDKANREGAKSASKHRDINLNFGGWQKGTMNIVAARPAMGKSAWHVSELLHCAQNGTKCMSFNLEMHERQLILRMLCNMTGIPNTIASARQWRIGEELQWLEAQQILKGMDATLTLDFTGGITIDEIEAKVRKMRMEKGLDLVFLDHLQFIRVRADESKGMNRDSIIGAITSRLKALAKNEDVALIVLSHLRRAVESEKSKRPSLADLRESGNIENDADTVSFLMRPEYYLPKDSEGRTIYADAQQESFKEVCMWYCDKNRDGATFETQLKCYLGISKFTDDASIYGFNYGEAPGGTSF